MRHVIFLILFFSGPVCAHANAQFDTDIRLRSTDWLHGETSPHSELQLHTQGRWILRNWELHAEGRVRWNESYADTQTYSKAARKAYRLDADWREIYVATQRNGWQNSLGWQQVVWGRADNLRILDQVNPLDFREFVLPELNDYRRSVLMLRTLGQWGDWMVEAIYLPGFVGNRMAAEGSPFFIPTVEPLIAQGVEIRPHRYPKNLLGSAEIGVHLSRSFGARDVSGVLFYTRNDDPIYRIVPTGTSTLVLQPDYPRHIQMGFGFAQPVQQGFIFRSEWNLIPSLSYTSLEEPDGVIQSSTLRGLLGLDYLWRDWLVSVQTSDRFISNWQTGYWDPEHQIVTTFSATGSSLSARLETRLALTLMSQRNGQWLQVKNNFKPNDQISLGCTLDLLSGDPSGFFGQFRRQDRLQLDIRYLF